MKKSTLSLAILLVTIIAAQAQQGRWAAPDDATARFILDAEEQWEEAACNHNKSPEIDLEKPFLEAIPLDITRLSLMCHCQRGRFALESVSASESDR